jgi:hypothetical protein
VCLLAGRVLISRGRGSSLCCVGGQGEVAAVDPSWIVAPCIRWRSHQRVVAVKSFNQMAGQ